MKAIIRSSAGFRRLAIMAMAGFSGTLLSLSTTAQQAMDADQVEQMVDYAQCIRDNGYPAFPDPAPGGGFQFRIERGEARNFEAASRACRDKLPSGVMQGMQAATPEQLELQTAFAGCMREQGIADFPDPSPQGGFDVNTPKLDLRSSRVQGAMRTCREIHPITLMIRRGG